MLIWRVLTAAVGAATLTVGLTAAPSEAAEERRVVRYVVRSGDTATGLAVRFHAWTDELLALNHLSSRSTLHVGQVLRIPVVPAADRPSRAQASPAPASTTKGKVSRVVAATAKRYGVDPELALAVSWQESGWQMDRVSSAHAIGAMQVLRPTGRWMSLYVGRPLQLRRLQDNAAAGVMLLRVLWLETGSVRRTLGGYYQGLGAVRRHGLYPETRTYVRNVLAIRERLENGHKPT